MSKASIVWMLLFAVAGTVMFVPGGWWYVAGVFLWGIALVVLLSQLRGIRWWGRTIGAVLVVGLVVAGLWFPNALVRMQVDDHEVWTVDAPRYQSPVTVDGALLMRSELNDALVSYDLATGERSEQEAGSFAEASGTIAADGTALITGLTSEKIWQVWRVRMGESTLIHERPQSEVWAMGVEAADGDATVISECDGKDPIQTCTYLGVNDRGGELWNRPELSLLGGVLPNGAGVPRLALAYDRSTSGYLLLDPRTGETVASDVDSTNPYAPFPEALPMRYERGDYDERSPGGELSLALDGDELAAVRGADEVWRIPLSGVQRDEGYVIANGVIAVSRDVAVWSPYLEWMHPEAERIALIDAQTGSVLNDVVVTTGAGWHPVGGPNVVIRKAEDTLTLVR